MSGTWESLCAALAGVPKLDGARCVGLGDVFDQTDDPELVAFALSRCAQCPALSPCAEWFNTLRPSQRPEGVVAGAVRRTRDAQASTGEAKRKPKRPRPKPRPRPQAVPAPAAG